MTNGEKLQSIFPDMEWEAKDSAVLTDVDNGSWFSLDWWNAEYKEPNSDIRLNRVENELNQDKNELESTTKNDLTVDCIDREELLKAMDTWDKFGYTETGCFVREPKGDYVPYVHYEDMVNCVKGMSSVTPIRPKGHWICDGKGRSFADYHCSECGLKLALCGQDIKQRQDSGYSLFCGGCGADMREVEE